jgi:hypothetical protein
VSESQIDGERYSFLHSESLIVGAFLSRHFAHAGVHSSVSSARSRKSSTVMYLQDPQNGQQPCEIGLINRIFPLHRQCPVSAVTKFTVFLVLFFIPRRVSY